MVRSSLAIALLLVAGCSPTPSPQLPATTPSPLATSDDRLSLHANNLTPLAIGLSVDGKPVGTVAPRGSFDLAAAALPAVPWTVTARTASGRVLTELRITADALPQPQRRLIAASRVVLTCGRLDVWAGDDADIGPLPVATGHPGDCAP